MNRAFLAPYRISPKPWKIQGDVIIDNEGNPVLFFYPKDIPYCQALDEESVNARVICAASEMFELLKTTKSFIEFLSSMNGDESPHLPYVNLENNPLYKEICACLNKI